MTKTLKRKFFCKPWGLVHGSHRISLIAFDALRQQMEAHQVDGMVGAPIGRSMPRSFFSRRDGVSLRWRDLDGDRDRASKTLVIEEIDNAPESLKSNAAS